MAGLYYDQFTVGRRFVHELRRTILESDNMLFSNMTMNPAAIHIDHDYASRTEYGRPLVNSLLTLGLVIGLSVQDTTLGTTIANVKLEETVFPKPVFAGDTICVETEVVAMRESKSRPTQGLVTLLHTAFNQQGEIVCTCQRVALMMKTPSGGNGA
ncbi:MAG: MaoC family dehydratase [Sphingomicrobium sp.]